MWRPGFDFIESVPARLTGSHRSLCVHSYHHRGTPERPGLVLGLAAGGACRGLAFKVSGKNRTEVIGYLREREQVTMVYLEKWRRLKLLQDEAVDVPALCYVADPAHRQYAGRLGIAEQIRCIHGNAGKSGDNADYVYQTVRRLQDLNIHDGRLEALSVRLKSASGKAARKNLAGKSGGPDTGDLL